MSFQHIAFRFVQPRNHDQFVTDFHSQQRIGEAALWVTERRVPRLQCGFPSMKAKGATKSSEIVVDVQDPAAPIFEAARLIENHTTKAA